LRGSKLLESVRPHFGESIPAPKVLLPASHPLATILACTVLSLAAMDVLGWLFHLPLLTSMLPHYATMKPNTAACLAFLAAATLLKRRHEPQALRLRLLRPRVVSIASLACALLALVFAFVKLLEYKTSHNAGLDALLIHTQPDVVSTTAGRLALGTVLCVVLISVALIALDAKPGLSLAVLLTSAFLAFSALIGFIFDAGPHFGFWLLSSIAAPTALSLLMLQLSTLALRPEREPFVSFTHVHRSGRRQWLLLGVTVVPALVALPLLFAMKAGLMHPPFALALLVVVLVCIQLLILWQDSSALSQLEGRRKQTEQALLQSEKLAVVGRLAASISHEINNPLEAIGNILYLIRNAESLASAQEYSLMAEQELSRVAQITTQTLSFYRELRHPALYLPTSIVDSALTLLSGKISTARVSIRVDFHDNVQPILCREGELRQVFVNLISNAIEATPPGGQLVVRVRPSSSWRSDSPGPGVRVLIADSGRGISPEFRDRIFEPFFTTKAHETGNGLGLWVVADLIEKQGGMIRMSSSQLSGWQGTTFCVFLPYAAPAPDHIYLAGTAAEVG
jgi:signal transduction histidine kinase